MHGKSERELNGTTLSANFPRRAYGNEKPVGEGVRASGVPRKDIFVS